MTRLPTIGLWTLAAIAALAAGLVFGRLYLVSDDDRRASTATAATVLAQPQPLPDVRLVSADGQAFGRQQLAGGWHLLFFGFTHCPDICPETLGLLAAVEDRLAEQGGPPQVVFVSVDPRRDDPATLREYLAHFDAGFVGVTGPAAEIERLTRALYLPFSHVGDVESGDYTVDHSGALILVDPQARALAYFTAPHDPESLLADLRRLTRG